MKWMNWTWLILFLGFMPTWASACGFHIYTPEKTAIDRIVAADQIVLARTSASNPFRFESIFAYRGDVSADIPHLVDSRTRRQLRRNDRDTVMFARDRTDGSWHRLVYLDQTYRAVMDEVMQQVDAWVFSEKLRFRYFAHLLHHPHPKLARLAYAELDRAPYADLNQLELHTDVEDLLDGIFSINQATSLPIRVLLLGLSDDERARIFLREQFAQGRIPTGVAIGAFAVALIEIDGTAALAPIARTLRDGYFNLPTDRETLIEAMAIQSQAGGDELEAAIQSLVSKLVREDPTLAAATARQFQKRNDWSQNVAVASALASDTEFSAADRFDIEQYLSFATHARRIRNN